MSDIKLIVNKIKKYVRRQRLIDLSAYSIFTSSTILIAFSVALFLLKSPIYAVIGIIPLFLYRPMTFIEGARKIEKKIGLKGELVNSIQLSCIPQDSKEKYSQELINAYISDTGERVKEFNFKKYASYKPLYNAARFLLISIAISLIHPAFLPEHFWYSLNHELDYFTKPGNQGYIKGTAVELVLYLNGVYLPAQADLIISEGKEVSKDKTVVRDGIAKKRIKLEESITYQFAFLDHKTDTYTLVKLEPIYIEALSFHLEYPKYTKLNNETKTGRQIIAPKGTKVFIQGRASQPLESAQFLLNDTLALKCEGKTFAGEFLIREGGTAILYLKSFTELKEPIIIYSIPDLAPLVDIFYPGYNINLPSDMRLDIGIRCSDDYGLAEGVFYYKFKDGNKKILPLRKGVLEDTIYFEWDLSNIGMLPGDEISYSAEITDNAKNVSRSKTYYIHFPTMEEIYDQISEKTEMIEKDLINLQSGHTTEIEKLARIQKKIMKERDLSWADQEKLQGMITKEKEILDKIDEWKTELERTIEKLNEGIILDRESIERLQEITRILQEIAPDDLKESLENLQLVLNKNPQDIQKALDELKKNQEELAKALARTLELLRRYQQEEKLKELAQMAKELASKADEIDKLMNENKNLIDKETKELNKGIDELSKGLEELAESEGLEQEIREALKKLAEQACNISKGAKVSLTEKKHGLNRLAEDLVKLYESLTKDRAAALRKSLLEMLNQLVDISKSEEDLYQKDKKIDIDQQDRIINATKTAAESLYAQQTKSLYVTPNMGKNLAKAINNMKRAKQINKYKHSAQEAMKFINLVCLEMLQSLEKASQGGSSTGMDKFLEGLSDIAKGQMSLSQSMSGFLPIPVTGLTTEQKAQLQRLAGRQRALREALESLRSEPGAEKYQELLDNLLNEMAKTEEALYQYKLDRELVERQRMIISRLLDAQKSIRKENYQERRESKPGQDFLSRESPKPLPEELGRDELRELIQKALREPYPEEYEFYIREYFKNLLEENFEKKKLTD